jgi:diadenosine tetraphosphatase ApaH/serine/threonine PP2A family protein phosphatase
MEGFVEPEDLRTRLDKGEIIGELIVNKVFDLLIDVLIREDNIVEVQTPVVICGDIHGQYEDLKKLFREALTGIGTSPKDTQFIFMGDYVDRGKFSLNTFLLLASYKIENPHSFFLLRGNHESRQVTQQYGFQNEILGNYGHTGLWMKCMDVFDLLPIAALTDRRVFSLHGGLSPHLPLVQDLLTINRRKEIPDSGLLADLTWSDPDERNVIFRPNGRGAGCIFGRGPTEQFCHINGLDFITRSHQVVQTGFKWFFSDVKSPGKLINVWSAPNYGASGNIASVLRLGFPGKEEHDLPTFTKETNRILDDGISADPLLYFA